MSIARAKSVWHRMKCVIKQTILPPFLPRVCIFFYCVQPIHKQIQKQIAITQLLIYLWLDCEFRFGCMFVICMCIFISRMLSSCTMFSSNQNELWLSCNNYKSSRVKRSFQSLKSRVILSQRHIMWFSPIDYITLLFLTNKK